MNCSFIAYPAEPEHKTVLEVFREPIGRKNGEETLTCRELRNTKNTLMNKIEMAGRLTGYDLVIRKGQASTFSEILFKAPFFVLLEMIQTPMVIFFSHILCEAGSIH